jgi:PIN domain nuclease of toxin-antitoxin system
MLNLDTHILLFALMDGDLTSKERRLLSRNEWSISAIVLWEICKLSQLKKIEIDLKDKEIKKVISSIQVWPIDFEVCNAMLSLDFKSDPADELIAATSLVHDLPLLTRDKRILKSKLIDFA